MYITYDEYKAMGGTLDESSFCEYEFEARTIVDWYTFNRLKAEDPEDYPSVLPMLMNRLIKMAVERANAMSMGGIILADGTVSSNPYVSSQSNVGVSISYNTISAKDLFADMDKQMGETIKRYLDGIVDSLGRKLLYRGLYPNE